ncbi:hypothetical protein YC2023_072348 [Brassica napus]
MGGQQFVTPRQTCPRPEGLGRNLRSKTRWFTEFCNSHQVSHFATFFIDMRAEIYIAESLLGMDESITTESACTVRNQPTESDVSSFSGRSVSRITRACRPRCELVEYISVARVRHRTSKGIANLLLPQISLAYTAIVPLRSQREGMPPRS